MNRKTIIIAGLCALSLCAWAAQTTSLKPTPTYKGITDSPPGYEEIVLHGDLILSINPNAIEAGVSDNAVYVQFNQSFGNVAVMLYNPLGLTVYSGVVNTAVQQTLVIPVALFVEGTYTLTLENASGYADGDFEKQP